MTNPSLILPQSPAFGENNVYAARVEDGAVPLYNVLPLDFTRASNGTRVNKDGLIENMPYNLLEYSEDFSNGYWSKLNATVTANNTTAPNGTNTADLITSTGTTETGVYIIPSVIGTNTWSIYAKKGTGRYLFFNTNTPLIAAKFDLQDGVIVGTPSTGVTPSIESVGNGWYRCIITSSTSTNRFTAFITNNTTTDDLTSSVGLSYYIYGAQLNIGSTAKPYLATTDRLDMPRITYPIGGGCGSLLLEPQRTNLLTYSEDFNSWFNVRNTLYANSGVSPDGTSNAYAIIPQTSNDTHFIYFNTNESAVAYSYSLFAKSNGLQWIQLARAGGGYANFDLVNGVTGNYGVSITNSEIQDYGNGWYKITAYYTSAGGASNVIISALNSNTTSRYDVFAGNNTDGYYIYGAQLEAGSYHTSYIPTYGAAATRVADACSKTGISDLIGQTEGTLFAEVQLNVKPESGSPVAGVLTLNNNVNDLQNAIILGVERLSGGPNKVYCFVQVGNVTQAALFGSNITDGSYKIAFAYKANDFALYVNGAQVATDTSGSVPTTSELLIGKRFQSDSVVIADSINQATIYKTRLSNTELANITSL